MGCIYDFYIDIQYIYQSEPQNQGGKIPLNHIKSSIHSKTFLLDNYAKISTKKVPIQVYSGVGNSTFVCSTFDQRSLKVILSNLIIIKPIDNKLKRTEKKSLSFCATMNKRYMIYNFFIHRPAFVVVRYFGKSELIPQLTHIGISLSTSEISLCLSFCVSYGISLCLCEIRIYLFGLFTFAKIPDNKIGLE